MFSALRNGRSLAGALLLSLAFGSIHAFGVLLLPLEQHFGATRFAVSSGYSVALASLTAGVLSASYISRRLNAATAAATFGLLGSAGLVLAAQAGSVTAYIAGYGLVFGFCNGIVYVLFLDQAARAMPSRQGLAIGIVTATYGTGAAIFAPILGQIAERQGVAAALLAMAAAVAASALAGAATFRGEPPVKAAAAATGSPASARSWLARLWFIYLLSASGSLMIIAHAEAILVASGAAPSLAHLAPSLFALGNIAGSFAGGAWAAGNGERAALLPPILLSIAGMVGLAFGFDTAVKLACLALLGIAYGAMITAVPVVIRDRLGEDGFGLAFGRVFTAWGFAGLCGPSIGSVLSEWSTGYWMPLTAATAAAAGAAMMTLKTTAIETGERRPDRGEVT